MIVAASGALVHAQTPESRAPVVPTTPRFEMYTTADGLPGNIMRGVVQDSLGYIWVGGVGGVARFDGTRFEEVPLDDVPSYTADVSNVGRLYADPQGTVWVATFGEGLQRYDQRTQRFEAYLPDSTDTSKLFGSHVYALLTDRRGRTWVSSRYDLDSPENSRVQWLDAETGTFTPFEGRTHADTLSDEASDFLEDRDGMIWIADYYDGLQRYDPETGTVTRFRHDPADPTTLHGDRLMTLYEDRDGYIWAGGGDYFGQTDEGGLSRFDPETETFLRFTDGVRGFQGTTVISLGEDASGSLWAGVTPGNMVRYDRATQTFTRLPYDPTDPTTGIGPTAHAMLTDRTGSFWVATWGAGLSRRDAVSDRFQHLALRPVNTDTYGLSESMSVLRDRQGHIWIGTWGEGLLRYDPASDRFTRYTANPGDPRALTSGFVRSLYEDRSGTLWAGTFFGGLHRYDRATDTFTRYVPIEGDTTSLPGQSVRSLYEDAAGRFWVGLWGGDLSAPGGLARMDRETGTFTPYLFDPSDSTSIGGSQVTRITEDADGRIWTTFNGSTASYLDPETDTITTLPDSLSLVVDFVHIDQRDRVWFGGFTGLIQYDISAGIVAQYGPEDGLLDVRISNIQEDADGRLWLAHEHGMTRFDPETKAVRTFDQTQGVALDFFINSVSHQDPSGLLFFGGIGGIMAFHPDDLARNTIEPPVVLTEVRIANEPVAVSDDGPLTESLATIESLRLAHNENDVGFSFAALHFLNAAHNTFAYRLDGHDRDWIEAGTQQTATYTNLAPGRYAFRVKAANADGVWNEAGVALPIVVAPPWWATPFAYLLYTLAFLGLLFVGFRTQRQRIETKERERRRALEARKLELEETVEARTAEIQHRVEELGVINSVQQGLVAELEMQAIYDLVGDRLRDLFDAQIVIIASFDHAAGTEREHYFIEKGVRGHDEVRAIDTLRRRLIDTKAPILINEDLIGALVAMGYDRPEPVPGTAMPQAMLFVPLVTGDTVRGYVSLQNLDHERAFSDGDVRLLTTLANSMTVALENARLFNETTRLLDETEQRNSELAVINSVQDGLVAELEMQAIYDLVGDRLRDLFDAQVVVIRTFDPQADTEHLRYAVEKGERYLFPDPRPADAFTHHLMTLREPLRVNEDFAGYVRRFDDSEDALVGDVPKSALFVPMVVGGTVRGNVSLQNVDHEGAFSEEDLRLLTTLTNSMSVALENARLFAESRQQAVELDTVNRVSRALNSQLDFDALVHLVGERMRETFDADIVYVAMHDRSTNLIHFPYAFGEDFDAIEYGEGLTSQILRTREPLLMNRDVQAETERMGIAQLGKESASYLGVPIRAGDAALGVISVQSMHQENRFDESDLRLLNTIAANVGVALQNADAYGRLNTTLEELTRTQQQLVQQEKLASLGQLTAGIAHEIKNPLNFINNFAEVNQELAGELREVLQTTSGDGGPRANGDALPDEVGPILDDIERTAGVIAEHGKRADGIVRAMMQHAHGGQGARQTVDLNKLVAEHVALAYHGKRAQVPDFSVSVEKVLGEGVGHVEVVPQEIGRVLVNLVGNAFDAVADYARSAPAGGNGEPFAPRVLVSTERLNDPQEGDMVTIRVADNGPGIPGDLRTKVFEPFFTTKPTGSGTGLGLSMSYDIVTQGHGGTLTVEDAPDGGAVFVVTLPVSAHASSPAR